MSAKKFLPRNFRIVPPDDRGDWGLVWRVGDLRVMQRGFPTLAEARLAQGGIRAQFGRRGPRLTHRALGETRVERWARRARESLEEALPW